MKPINSVNSPPINPPKLTIKAALAKANWLTSISDTPLLDCEIILMHVMHCDRAFLYAHSDEKLSESQEDSFQTLLARRQQGEPIAYITEKKAFWTLDLKISKDTLIPRPETELLVEIALNTYLDDKRLILDIATGSGAIAAAIAYERPNWEIFATDISDKALNIAQQNKAKYHLNNLQFVQMNWADGFNQPHFDLIIANPPYIDDDDPHLSEGDVQFEPRTALVSPEHGTFALKYIARQALSLLKPCGWLMLEHGFAQAEFLRRDLVESNYKNINTHKDLAGLDRITIAQK